MTKRIGLAALAPIAGAVALALAPGAGAAPGGGLCQLNGSAHFDTPLSGLESRSGTYSFQGALTGCTSTEAGAPAKGTVEAGRTIDIGGVTYQEPKPTLTGTCANGHTEGLAVVRWANGKNTVVQYATDNVAAGVVLTGKVVPGMTVTAADGATSTIATTLYQGNSSGGPLVFEADASQCQTGTLSDAGIVGVLGLGHQ